MSYLIDPDGRVTFTCNVCCKKVSTYSHRSIPKGWCVTGLIHDIPDPETGEEELDLKAREVSVLIGAHFCSVECGKAYLGKKRAKEMIRKAGVALALYSGCEIVLDGTCYQIAPGQPEGPFELEEEDTP